MKKSLLLLVPLMVLVGCSINGLKPLGSSNTENGDLGGLATLTFQIIPPDKPTLEIDELNITNANFRLTDVLGGVQTRNWVPPLIGVVTFNPILPGLTAIRIIDTDAWGQSTTLNTNYTIKGGYNYVFKVGLGGQIYMVETNIYMATVSNYMAIYSETHAVPTLNNAFNPLNGGNLYIWTPNLTLTEVGTGIWEGASNWYCSRLSNTATYIGFGISITNGAKNKSIYSGGHLKFAVKAFNAGNTYRVGIQSITGSVTNDAFVNLTDIPGYAADGTWKSLSVPMSDFVGINFAGIYTYFYLSSTAIVSNTNTAIYLDDIYWSRD